MCKVFEIKQTVPKYVLLLTCTSLKFVCVWFGALHNFTQRYHILKTVNHQPCTRSDNFFSLHRHHLFTHSGISSLNPTSIHTIRHLFTQTSSLQTDIVSSHNQTSLHTDIVSSLNQISLHRDIYTQTFLHTEIISLHGWTSLHSHHLFTWSDISPHRHLLTASSLHSDISSHRHLFTQTISSHNQSHPHTDISLHKHLVTQSDIFTQTCLHTDVIFSHRHLFTQTSLHTDIISSHNQTYLHTDISFH